MALDNTKIKSKTTLDAVLRITNWEITTVNQVLIRYTPAHIGYVGNEKEDTLAKKMANKTDVTLLNLPIPKVAWNVAIRKRTKQNMD